jgi:putative Holliday junction resolvase
MGIDYGTKRVGVALTDESGAMAFPEGVLPNDTGLCDALAGLARARDVAEIVIGHSLDKNGQPNVLDAAVRAFITDLTLATGLPIHLEPEQYTTQAALREQGRTPATDASAAALILQSYLDKQST